MKNKKQFLVIGLVSSFLSIPLVSSSHVLPKTQNLKLAHHDEQSTPQLVDSEPEKNKKYFENNFKPLIDEVIKQVKTKLSADSSEDRDPNTTIYYLQLLKFLDKIKESGDLETNPTKYGFNLNFLSVFGNTKYRRGSITYDGTTTNGVIFGDNNQINGNNFGYSNKEDFQTSNGEEVENKITNSMYQTEYFNKYKANLLKDGIPKIFFNEANIKSVEGKYKAKIDNSKGTKELVVSDLSLDSKDEKKITTWEDYFRSIIDKNFNKFDIEQNQQLQPESQSKPPIEVPPLKSNDDVNDANPNKEITINKEKQPTRIDLKLPEEIRNIQNLKPMVIASYDNLTPKEFLSYSLKEQRKMVYIDNPVQQRFDYQILSLKPEATTEQSLDAQIELKDKIVSENSRKYQAKIDNFIDKQAPSEEQLLKHNTNLLNYNSYLVTKEIVNKIQNAFKINLDLSDLTSFQKGQQFHIKNSFFLITKIYFNSNFVNDINIVKQKYLDKDLSQNLQNTYQKEIQDVFLSYLFNSKIDTINFNIYLKNFFMNKIKDLKTKILKNDKLIKLINDLNLREAEVSMLWNKLEMYSRQIDSLNQSADKYGLNDFVKMLNIMINANKIYEPIFNLYQVSNNASNKNKSQEIKTSLQNLITEINKPNNILAVAMTILGVFLTTLIITVIIIRYKKFKVIQKH
ncbi:MSC_0620 family F1-like ATPase-associated subunit [Mycoplasma amphoriforme]